MVTARPHDFFYPNDRLRLTRCAFQPPSLPRFPKTFKRITRTHRPILSPQVITDELPTTRPHRTQAQRNWPRWLDDLRKHAQGAGALTHGHRPGGGHYIS